MPKLLFVWAPVHAVHTVLVCIELEPTWVFPGNTGSQPPKLLAAQYWPVLMDRVPVLPWRSGWGLPGVNERESAGGACQGHWVWAPHCSATNFPGHSPKRAGNSCWQKCHKTAKLFHSSPTQGTKDQILCIKHKAKSWPKKEGLEERRPGTCGRKQAVKEGVLLRTL